MAGAVEKIADGNAYVRFSHLGYNGVIVPLEKLPFPVQAGQRVSCTIDEDGQTYKEMHFRDWKLIGEPNAPART